MSTDLRDTLDGIDFAPSDVVVVLGPVGFGVYIRGNGASPRVQHLYIGGEGTYLGYCFAEHRAVAHAREVADLLGVTYGGRI